MKRKSSILIGALPLLLILVGLSLYQYAYLPMQTELKGLREEKAMKAKTLKKYQGLIAEQPQLQKRLGELKEQRKAADSKTIDSRTPALGAAALQDTVKGIVLARGGTISSERVEKPEDFENFKVITVSMDAILPDIRAMSDILYSVETRTPFLAVREVDARVRNFKEPRELMVKLKISALMAGQ